MSTSAKLVNTFLWQRQITNNRGESCCWSSASDSSANASPEEPEVGSTGNKKEGDAADLSWQEWSDDYGIEVPKLSVRKTLPEERGKGGVYANEPIAALEVMMRVPRSLVLASCDMPLRAVETAANANNVSWATDLTAAALAAMFPHDNDNGNPVVVNENHVLGKQTWIQGWKDGGWATDGADLGPSDVNFGPKNIKGSLLATGSDNDHNIYAKFRMPAHPVVFRASIGLADLIGAERGVCLEALTCRGRSFRSMRDALFPLVDTPTERERSGSLRERRTWDVADMLSRVLSRATTLELVDGNSQKPATCHCIVPLHERLAHCGSDETANSKLVASPAGDEILLVAMRDIKSGEEITRDYMSAPRLPGDSSDGALRLLLQFGSPPSAWPPTTPALGNSNN